jgi:2-oxoglutarate dehydrogenase E2 component (dihydrolipoamide succinyltransferase)
MSNDGGSRFYSPLVLNIARAEGISMSQLESLSGTGKEGRVTKADILDFVANRGTGSANAPVSAPVSAPVVATSNSTAVSIQTPAKVEVKSSISLNPGDEIIEMDRVRKMIADHMVMSKHTSPHVQTW